MLTAANFPERAHELKSKVDDVSLATKEVRTSQVLLPPHALRELQAHLTVSCRLTSP